MNWIDIGSIAVNMDQVTHVEFVEDHMGSKKPAILVYFNHSVEGGYGNIVQGCIAIEDANEIEKFLCQFERGMK